MNSGSAARSKSSIRDTTPGLLLISSSAYPGTVSQYPNALIHWSLRSFISPVSPFPTTIFSTPSSVTGTTKEPVNAPEEPIMGPVHLRIDFFFGTSDVKKQGCWKVTRPDTDNLIKLMKDCMTEAGFWRDDSQVCMEVVSKTWVPEDEACTRIQLYQMQTH